MGGKQGGEGKTPALKAHCPWVRKKKPEIVNKWGALRVGFKGLSGGGG